MSTPKTTHVVCLDCHLGQERTLKKSFLGFPSFACEGCGARSAYPLSTAYVVIYCASAFLAMVPLVTGRGSAGCFVVLGVAAIPALVMQVRARRRLREALANERGRGERVAETFR